MKYTKVLRFLLFVLIAVIALYACKGKKKASLSGEEPVDISDFISFFQDVELPVTISDTTLSNKTQDSFLISHSVISAFIPDSLLGRDFGKATARIYALGRAKEKGKETYLFIKAVQGSKRAGYVLCFDNKNKFRSAMPLIRSSADNNYTSAYGSLDKKFQITTYWEKKNKSGIADFKRNVYIFNNASDDFTLIVTEPGQERSEGILNPIDTFPAKNKFSGDYIIDKKNFVSFRDSRKPSELLFFTHFEKEGDCKGELRGTARFVSSRLAQYKENGNPCTLEFAFNASSVAMKEVEGCGSYRDIKCFFDGTYSKKKKKEIKEKASKKQTKK